MPSVRDLVGRGGDLVLAAAVALGACLVVVKVPTRVMDVLPVVKLAIAAVVLAAATKSAAWALVVEHVLVRRPLRSVIERRLPREVAVGNAGAVSLAERS